MKNVIAILGLCLSIANSQDSKTITFTPSNEDIPNQERGWNVSRNMTGNLGTLPSNIKLVFGRVVADNFRNQPLSDAFLTQFDNFFAAARKAGVKLNPRFSYNYNAGGQDAPIDIVLNHIKQIKPILVKNKDVLNVLDPGFIGNWGEWHSSTSGLNTPENEKKILEALLEALPVDRMLYIRYPFLKRRIFGGDYNAKAPWLDSSKAFDGSNLSRVGHLNDCFLSSSNDVGTYQKGWTRAEHLAYVGQESRYTPFGGETCAISDEGRCPNTIKEMEQLHINHLHNGFHQGVISRWKSEGCHTEITLRLGYRFVLQSTTLDTYVPPGGTMKLSFTVKNVGFGELFNPRPVEVVLLGPTGTEIASTITVDPRWWGAGMTKTIALQMKIPVGIVEGTYRIALRLPDASESIRKDYRYAIRFANTNVWDAATGSNILATGIRISKSAPGTVNPTYTQFGQMGALSLGIASKVVKSEEYQVSWLSSNKGIRIHAISDRNNPIQVSLLDLNGRPVAGIESKPSIPTDGQLLLPMKELRGGVYFLNIHQGEKSIVRRIATLQSNGIN
jgi:Domain of unknown function (DUF4832)/Domain of unknown function (DUF4874)